MAGEDDAMRDWQDVPDDAVSVDLPAIRSVLEDHPVRVAVLFGSQVDGTTDASSDVDLAVEFDGGVSDRSAALLRLLADLSIALGRNDVDIALVENLAPRVGLAAFEEGILLAGTSDAAREHRDRFDEHVTESSTRSLRDRFDAALAAVDRHVDGEA